MRLLLDTHTAIWAVEDDSRLPPHIRATVENPTHELWLSVASVWEMSIKQGLGKLGLKTGVSALVASCTRRGVRLLPIELSHVLAVQSLPHHHDDPFDPLLVAQTRSEGLTVVSRDAAFGAYGVARSW